MKTSFWPLLFTAMLTMPFLPSCRPKCEECTYYETSNGETAEIPLGEQCGDEIEALEKKEYHVTNGEGHTECE